MFPIEFSYYRIAEFVVKFVKVNSPGIEVMDSVPI